MSTAIYDYRVQYDIGEEGARSIDEFFRKWYFVSEVTARELQLLSIDRVFTCKKTGRVFSVEYKTDNKAYKTKNVFIETISATSSGRLGWAYLCLALYIVYYIPQQNTAYLISTVELKKIVPEWKRKYQERIIPNKGYDTAGLIVPIREFSRYCEAKFDLIAR